MPTRLPTGRVVNSPAMDAPIERILVCKEHAWGRRARALGGRQVEHDGLVTTLTGIPVPWLNPTTPVRDPRDPLAAILAAEADLPGEVGGFGMDIVIDRFPAIREAAAAAGLERRVVQPIMVVAPSAIADVDLPDGVALIRAEDRAEDVAAVDAAAFGDPLDVSRAFLDARVFGDETFRLYAAVRGTEVVAIATTSLVDGVLSVNGVGTVESERRKGIGAALTSFAVRDRADHADMAFLESSEMAFGVYERLGFATLAIWEVWTRP